MKLFSVLSRKGIETPSCSSETLVNEEESSDEEACACRGDDIRFIV